MRRFDISRKIRKAFTENIALKGISLFISIILWIVVSGERDTEWAYLIPLKLKNIPKDMMVTNNVPDFLDVRMQGPRTFMMEIKPQEMTVEMNTADLKPGSNIYPVTSGHIRVPRGVTISSINPSYLTLEAERLVRKEVEVKGDIKGRPAADFVVESIEVIPSVTTVGGAESDVEYLKELLTSVVDISGIKENLRKQVSIDKAGKNLRFVKDEPVTVVVNVRELTKKMELRDVVVKVLGGMDKVIPKPSRINLLIEGPKSLVDHVGRENVVSATVHIDGLKAGRHKVKVDVVVPEKINILYSHPKDVIVMIPK